jgi:hypothetical protein
MFATILFLAITASLPAVTVQRRDARLHLLDDHPA